MNDKYYESGHEENDGFVALTGEDGNVEKFYHVGTIDLKDVWYVFFQPAEPKDGVDPDELVVFKLSGDERNETLLPVKDEKLLEELYEEFMRELEDGEDEEPANQSHTCSGCEGCVTKKETEGRGCASCGMKDNL